MGHVVPDVELHFLSHGRIGVALVTLGAELSSHEVRKLNHDFDQILKSLRNGSGALRTFH